MLILTIVMMNNGIVLDIMVKPEQRIRDILNVLAENGQISYRSTRERLYVRSWRSGNLVNIYLTFKQADIFYGDILYIEVETSYEKSSINQQKISFHIDGKKG